MPPRSVAGGVSNLIWPSQRYRAPVDAPAAVLQEAWTALVQRMQPEGALTSLPDGFLKSCFELGSTPEGQLLDSSLQNRMLLSSSEVGSHSLVSSM